MTTVKRYGFIAKGLIVLALLCMIISIQKSFLSNKEKSGSNRISNEVQSSDTRERRYVFFDLGANNGDTVLAFFGLQTRFPQLLAGTLNYKQFGPKAERAKWLIYAFEANERFDKDLDYTVELMKNLTPHHDVQMFKHTAAWTYDGTVDFFIEKVTKFGYGSSLNSKHPKVVISKANATKTACRDIAAILKQFDANDFVVIKIDIEGAEYEFLLDLIKKDAVRFIDHFAIEFHKDLSKLDSPEAVLNAILKLYGATSSHWI